MTLACNLGVPVPTEILSPASPTIVPAPIDIITPTNIIPAPTSNPLGVFTLSILVDVSSEPVTREQAETIVDESSQILYDLTGFVFDMVDFQEVIGGGSVESMIQNYLNSPPAVIPNGIIIFHLAMMILQNCTAVMLSLIPVQQVLAAPLSPRMELKVIFI